MSSFGLESFVAGLGGSLFNTGLETWSANYLAKKADARNRATQEYLTRNSPTWQVEGLRDAGLNPILAVSNGVSTPQALNTAGAGKSNSDVLQNIATAKNFALQDEALRTQKAQTLKTNAEAYESYERTWNAQVQRKIAEAQLPAITAESILKASQSKFLEQYPELWKLSMIGNTADDVLSPFINGANAFVDGWLKNKGIDVFGNKQPPNHKPYDQETTFIGSDGKVKSKKRVRYK